MTRRLLPAVLLVLTVSACGGGGSSASDDVKAAYVTDASTICSDASAEADALGTPSDAAGLVAAVDTLVALGEKAQTDLAALTPPEQDAADLQTKVLTPFSELVTAGKAFAAKVQAAGTDSAALLPLLSQRPTGEGIDVDYLTGYGLKPCADLVTRLREG